jgi:aspartate carbamoyltransferase regulatory subunit
MKASSGTSGNTTITEITYNIDMANKNINVVNSTNPRAAINTYKNKEVCDKIKKQKRGYITSLDHKTACYMKKDKKAKE